MRVLVTGASNGIGGAAAEKLVASGAEVVAVDIDEPKVRVAAWHRADLGDPDQIDAIPIDGKFHALVNAAGIPPRDRDEARILSINYLGLVRLTERLLPAMDQGGSIVSLASKAGSRWRENIAQVARLSRLGYDAVARFVAAERVDPVRAYDLSKEAVIYWTKRATPRLRTRGLRANTVSPAAIETRILPDFEKAFGERATRGIALAGRAGTPDEVADVVVFLVRPESAWIRGVDLEVDGGLAAQLEIEKLPIPATED